MFIKKYLALVALSAIALSAHAEESKELKFLGKTVIHENGSWVNPNEPKFEAKKPSTWFKRNYVRHYMQGSQEITDSLFKFKNTIEAAKEHPEAVVVPVGMAAGSAVEGSKGTVVATVGLAKNVLTTSLKVIKFVSAPVRKIIPIKVESTNTNN